MVGSGKKRLKRVPSTILLRRCIQLNKHQHLCLVEYCTSEKLGREFDEGVLNIIGLVAYDTMVHSV